MKILAVGSEGNIGAPLVEYLRSVGHDVFTTDIKHGYRTQYAMADINHPLDLLDAFDWEPDVVYLMAAVVSRVACEQAGSLAVTTNLAGINNIITLTKRVGAKLIFFSTSEVYGPTEDLMDEDISIPHPNNRYGLTKWLGEQLVQYEVSKGLSAVTIRPFMIYSEDEDLGEHRSAMIRFAQNFSERKRVSVHTGSIRSWLHVTDAVVALERAIYVKDYQVINIGHPDTTYTDVLAFKICDKLKAPRSLVHLVDQPERMTLVKRPALHKQKELLKVTPLVSLEEGVGRVCARFV